MNHDGNNTRNIKILVTRISLSMYIHLNLCSWWDNDCFDWYWDLLDLASAL